MITQADNALFKTNAGKDSSIKALKAAPVKGFIKTKTATTKHPFLLYSGKSTAVADLKRIAVG